MEYITLNNSDLTVSRICIGGDPMGGHGWGNIEDSLLIEAINTAVDIGINFFDTADTYGLGKAETLLGRTLGSRKYDVVIGSKFSVRWTEDMKSYYDNSPEWIEQALQNSLKRLDRDYIDLYQLHWRDYKTPVDKIFEKLISLKEKGYIRAIGLSNVRDHDIVDFAPYKEHISTFQNEYSLANRENENDILKCANLLGINPMTWGSLGQGILTGKYDRNSVFGTDDRRSRSVYKNFHGEKLEKNLIIVEEMKKYSCESGHSLPSIAIRYILDYLKNSIVIAGVKNKNQVFSNAEAFGWELHPNTLQNLLNISK